MSDEAVFVIDMLKDFMPKSIYPDAKLPIKPAAEIVDPIKKVLTHAREQEMEIFYICDSHKPNSSEFEEWPRHCIRGSEGSEIIGKLRPSREDVIIKKNTYNAFSNSRLKRQLFERGIEKIYETGVVTDICVLNTAVEAKEKGFEVSVIEDCVSGLDSQREGMNELKENKIDTISIEEFLDEDEEAGDRE